MKLLQLNIWMGRLLPQVLKLIEEEKPDILCLQEVFEAEDVVPIPDLMMNSLRHIQNTSGLENIYFSPVMSMDVANTTAPFGNAIVSRFPLSNQQTNFINGEFMENYSTTNRMPNTRNFQYVDVHLPNDSTLHLINHHGYWLIDSLGDDISADMMKKVATFAKQLSGPLILSGDLNVVSASPAMRVFDGFLEDLTATHGVKSTLSQLGKVKDVACDHILINKEIKVSDFRVLDQLVSDHQGLILEFEL